MYSEKPWKFIRFYTSPKENTEKTIYANISEAINVGVINGKKQYEYDNWSAYFMGHAYEKAKDLKDGDVINLLKYEIRNRFERTQKKSYPMVRVFDFEVFSSKDNVSAADLTEKKEAADNDISKYIPNGNLEGDAFN